MKLTKSIIIFLLFTSFSFSQIKFEKGYFIKNSGEQVECLIKNQDWKGNPSSFEYKLSQDSKIYEGTLKEVSEFRIYDRSKFKRFNVDIDKSGSIIGDLSKERAAELKREVLFLRVLVEGASSLFSYEGNNVKRFFYGVNEKEVEQLIYKSYEKENGLIGKNNRYRQQLLNSLKSDCISTKQLENINYYKKNFVNLFLKYNTCNSDVETTYFEKKQKRDFFNVTIRPGVNSSSLTIDPPQTDRDAEFDNELSLRFGLELEFVLPFNKNKWSLILEPTFQSYNSETTRDALNNPQFPIDRTFVATYKSIEVPFGVRHSFYLSQNTKLFINASYVIDFEFNSEIAIGLSEEFDQTKTVTPIASRSNLALGFGVKYNKISTELRYGLNRAC